MRSSKKTLALTMGDPCGVGPELIAAALNKSSIQSLAKFVIIGQENVLKRYLKSWPRNVELVDVQNDPYIQYTPGQTNKVAGADSLLFLQMAASLIKSKDADAVVTAPVCKESICEFHPQFKGHTEFFQETFKVKHVDMMFHAPELRTVIVTRHTPLKDVPNELTSQKVFQSLKLTSESLQKQFGMKKPKIAVTGLNPHAGEHGIMGREDEDVISPAIVRANRLNAEFSGPLPADTLFTPQNRKKYDCVVAMYHDQGLIPIKTLYFDQVVNLTLGLPFVRTSPAHGTAFDIAGRQKVNPSSFLEAIKLAAKLKV